MLQTDADIFARFEAASSTMLGYPLNQNVVRSGMLSPFLGFVINNLGDPFTGGCYGVNSFGEECEIIRQFAELFHLPASYWGYVGSCGSEGNLRGLSFGKERFGRCLLYASDKAHYSVEKTAKLLGSPFIKIATDKQHRIDLDDFRRKVYCRVPSVVCLTAGTTMAGAVDDVGGILEILKSKGCRSHVHVDAALSGLILPFISGSPVFDFRLPIDSISVSGHKMLGVPIPCGIFVCREKSVPKTKIEYIGSTDATIGGSRSGLAVLAIKNTLRFYGSGGLAHNAKTCVALAVKAKEKIEAAGWPCWMNPWSNTVVLKRPNAAVCSKWQLAVEGDQAHIIVMPHVSAELLDSFVSDLGASNLAA